jgi:thiamine-monophosphate kinase
MTFDPDDVPAWLARRSLGVPRPDYVIAGINDDDCAVIEFGDQVLVVTTDFLNANPIAIELGIGSLYDVGRLLVDVNISDLCGSGAEPIALLTALTLPRDTTQDQCEELLNGIQDQSTVYHIPVIGGDTKLGASRALAATALGRAPSRGHLFLKNAARPGDAVFVSGALGDCNAAVRAFAELELDLGQKMAAKKAILQPVMPLTKSRAASSDKLGRGGIDISDGLGADLVRMCVASGVGVEVEQDSLPISNFVRDIAEQLRYDPTLFPFGCGGDCQFLLTTDNADIQRAEAIGMHRIGTITSGDALLLRTRTGDLRPLPHAGHRDKRSMSFVEEIAKLMDDARDLIEATA